MRRKIMLFLGGLRVCWAIASWPSFFFGGGGLRADWAIAAWPLLFFLTGITHWL